MHVLGTSLSTDISNWLLSLSLSLFLSLSLYIYIYEYVCVSLVTFSVISFRPSFSLSTFPCANVAFKSSTDIGAWLECFCTKNDSKLSMVVFQKLEFKIWRFTICCWFDQKILCYHQKTQFLQNSIFLSKWMNKNSKMTTKASCYIEKT